MNKSPREILDEGFARLAVLSQKRKEILNSLEEPEALGAGEARSAGLEKLETMRSSCIEEVELRAGCSRETIDKALSQIVNENERVYSGFAENLRSAFLRLYCELSENGELSLFHASEKIAAALHPLEKNLDCAASEMRLEAVEFLGRLEDICKQREFELNSLNSQSAGEFSAAERRLEQELESALKSVADLRAQRKEDVETALEKFYAEEGARLRRFAEEMDGRLKLVLSERISELSKSAKISEEELDRISVELRRSAVERFSELGTESLADLRASCDSGINQVSARALEFRSQTENFCEQTRRHPAELSEEIRKKCESAIEELKERPLPRRQNDSFKAAIEDSLTNLSMDLDAQLVDFKRQLSGLMQAQLEQISELCESAEKSINESAAASVDEIKEMALRQDLEWSEREQEILTRLKNLEGETGDTLSLLAGRSEEGGSCT